MVKAQMFDKNGFFVKEAMMKIANPYLIFQGDNTINSVRFFFLAIGQKQSCYTFYRSQFRVPPLAN